MKVVVASRRGWEMDRDPRIDGGRKIVGLYIDCFAYRI